MFPPPFSCIAPGSPATAAPQGYSVDLRRAVADQFKEQLKIPGLKVAYAAVNSVNRLDTIVTTRPICSANGPNSLTFLLRKEKEAASLLMADTYLSIEPIALGLRRGDSDFRLAVDTALSHIYRRGAIVQVFKGAFGPLTTPSPLLNALFQISGLPD